MIRNYIKIAIRNLTKNPVYSFINIAGLSIGLTAFVLIALWIQHEMSYDRFHAKAERIYRVVENQFYANSEIFPVAVTPAALAPHLKTNFPAIENAFRVNFFSSTLFYEDKRIMERGMMADPSILEAMTFEFIKGNSKTALTELNNLVITDKLAKKYFGDHDAIGKTFKIANNDFVVTAVIRELPENSHMRPDFIFPFEMIRKFGWDNLDRWGSNAYYTYALLSETATMESVNAQIKDVIKKNNENSKTEIYLQPLTDIHLRSKFTADIGGHGDIQYVYIFSSVAIFVLVIACINFMNLSTARSVKRAREVGMRKVIGAHRAQLIGQFLSESIVLSLIALAFALVACQVLLPIFNEVSGKSLTLSFTSPLLWLSLLLVSFFTGTIAGSYPALFLSAFKPVKVLKGTFKTGVGAVRFRQVLVVTQFALSITLIAGTLMVYEQLNFIRTKNLGYAKENVVGFWAWWLMPQYSSFKDELLAIPEVAGVTVTSSDITSVMASGSGYEWEGKDPESNVLFHQLAIDHDFLKTFNVHLSEGRDFSIDLASDSSAYILNEEAVRAIGLENPIGKKFGSQNKPGTIIGVAKDFHFKSIHQKIEPLVLFIEPDWYARIHVRLRAGNSEQAIEKIRAAYSKFSPDNPMELYFLDQDIEAQYRTEQRTGEIFNYFAFIAILISCLGLFGLVMFTTEQRVKEIGIRKVLGASVANLFSQISLGFIWLVVIANTLALPIAWYVMDGWLGGFAYHVEMRWTTFVIAALSSILIAWITMSWQSIKAATANPAKSLRSE